MVPKNSHNFLGAVGTLCIRVFLPHAEHSGTAVQCAGVAVDRAVAVRVAEPQAHGAIAPHREATDRSTCAVGARMEGALDKGWQLPGDMAGIGRSLFVVGVEAPVSIGHRHNHGKRPGVALDPAVSAPRGAIIRQTMQEVEHRKRWCAGLRINDTQGGLLTKNPAGPMDGVKRHGAGLSA